MEKSQAENDSDEGLSHELDAPPWLRVESTLMATARLIRKSYDEALEPFDLNLTSASLLMYVVEKSGSSQTALAGRLDVGRAAAGLVVDRLAKRGLVERQADSQDRRAWVVAATEKGSSLAREIAEVDEALRNQLRSNVSPESRRELAQLLLQMQANLINE